MIKIQELLFNDVENFDIEKLKEIPLTIQNYIDLIRKDEIQKTKNLFSKHLVDQSTKRCEPVRVSKKMKKEKQEEELKRLTDWHGFKKKDLTEEDELDIVALKLRKYINPKGSGRKIDSINKQYMQIGTVMDDHLDGRKGRIKKRDRKQRIIDQFKEEDQRIGFTKKKFQEIQKEKVRTGKNKRWMKMKKVSNRHQDLEHKPSKINF